MIVNVNEDSLVIHLPCVQPFEPISDVKIRMIVLVVTLSLAHLDIDAKMVDA